MFSPPIVIWSIKFVSSADVGEGKNGTIALEESKEEIDGNGEATATCNHP